MQQGSKTKSDSKSLKETPFPIISSQGTQGQALSRKSTAPQNTTANYTAICQYSKMSEDRGSIQSTAYTCESEKSPEKYQEARNSECLEEFYDGGNYNQQLNRNEYESFIEESQEIQCESSSQNNEQMKTQPEDLDIKIWKCNDQDSFQNFLQKQIQVSPNPFYFEQSQQFLKPFMRPILLDWMSEVCLDLHLRRNTLHLAIMYTDLFLTKEENVCKEDLQLIGVTSLHIASKIEEVQPHAKSQFIKTTEDGYTSIQLDQMEWKILQALNWYLCPVTIYDFANWILTQWDDFLHFHYSCFIEQNMEQIGKIQDENYRQFKISELESIMIFFKKSNEKSYKRYRHYMQIIDAIVLDQRYLQLNKNEICASLLYLIVQIYLRITGFAMFEQNISQLEQQFMLQENQLLQSQFENQFEGNYQQNQSQNQKQIGQGEKQYLALMEKFLSATMDEELSQLYLSASFLHPYIDEFPVNFDVPTVAFLKPKQEIEVSFQRSNIMKIFFPIKLTIIKPHYMQVRKC